jgi:hypothetical protein
MSDFVLKNVFLEHSRQSCLSHLGWYLPLPHDANSDSYYVHLFFHNPAVSDLRLSATLQDYLMNNTGATGAVGQILHGGFLQRKYVNAPAFTYTVPTLTIGGELDGLSRVTRIAEAFYQQVQCSA